MPLRLICYLQRRVGFECVKVYADQGIPADTNTEPPQLKRDAPPMTRRQGDIAANEPFSAVNHKEPMIEAAAILPPSSATAEEDDFRNIAMELGGTREDKPTKGQQGRGGRAEWTCSPEFELDQGGNPRQRPPKPGEVIDDMQPPEWSPWRPSDEEEKDDYNDLQVPDDLDDGYYWSP